MTAQAPSCETCNGQPNVWNVNFGAAESCPDCQPKPSEGTVSESNRETIETLRDIEAYFRKEAAYECENMGAGGSTIALGRWKRYYMALANVVQDLPELIAHDKELTQARATIERQAGEIKRQQMLLDDFHNIDDITRIRELEADRNRIACEKNARISQLEADLAAARLDAERCRQWFDAVQDLNHDFLDRDDYLLARKLYEQCGMRVPKSMEIAIAAGDGK